MMTGVARYVDIALIAALLAFGLAILLYRRQFLGTRWWPLLALGAYVGGAVVMANRLGVFDDRPVNMGSDLRDLRFILQAVCAGLLVVFAVPLIVRLYTKWIGISLDEREKAQGTEGVQAWLGGWNVILALAIALCAWQGYEYSFWGVLAMTLGLLLAYPAVRALSAAGQPLPAAASPAADLSDERERVLKLLETGKITAQEGAELLSALSETARPEPPAPVAMTAGGKVVLLGALLVVVGFFLPWYSVNIGQEINRFGRESGAGYQMRQPDGASTATWLQANFPKPVRAAGGDVPNGLGWIVLLLGVLAAALPLVKLNASRRAQKLLLFAPWVVGAFLIVYLLTNDIRHVSFGLPLVLGGYAVELVGLVKDGHRA